jgi:peroxiredoxin
VDFQPALRVGMDAPDFRLPVVGGGDLRLSSFRGQQHVLLEFGCITAPVFVADTRALKVLHAEFGQRGVQVLVVYTRETVPGDRYQPHRSLAQKRHYAQELRDEEQLPFPVLVDDLAGTVHRTYGLRPSPVYVVHRSGHIVYRASWNDPAELRLVLDQLVKSDAWETMGLSPLRPVYSERLGVLPVDRRVHDRVFARTGGSAERLARGAMGEHRGIESLPPDLLP